VNVAWIEQTAAEVPRADTWLSSAERERLGGFRFEKRRADWRLGRWTAKVAVSRSLAVPDLASIEIRPARNGSPRVFVADQAAPISISISHRNGTAMCAVSAPGTLLGCDLEAVEPRSEAFVADYFTESERAVISAAADSATAAVHWSAKESALKALGIGLGIDMRRLRVGLEHAAGGWNPLTVDYARFRTFHGWWRHAGGLVRTVAAAPAPLPPVPIT
jgi:4'-phosphopantetheinyl transferase